MSKVNDTLGAGRSFEYSASEEIKKQKSQFESGISIFDKKDLVNGNTTINLPENLDEVLQNMGKSLSKLPSSIKEFDEEFKEQRKETIENFIKLQLLNDISNGLIDPESKDDIADFYKVYLKKSEEYVIKQEKEFEDYKKNNPVPDKNDVEKYNKYQEDINTFETKIKCGKFDLNVINDNYRDYRPSFLQKTAGTGADILTNSLVDLAIMSKIGNVKSNGPGIYFEGFWTF